MNFLELGLSQKTIDAINELGINKPTTIQTDVIPAILRGDDVFAIAPKGCGKTESYVLPLIEILTQKKESQNILIITPTQKLSVMVSDRFSVFNKYHEVSDCENEANVLIATPDLLMEMQEENSLDLASINMVVVDDINFIKVNKKLGVLKKVLELLPEEKQSIIFTNRKSKDTDELLAKMLKKPVEVKVNKEKELEAVNIAPEKGESKSSKKTEKKFVQTFCPDNKAYELAGKNNTFKGRAPNFIFNKGVLASEN